MNDTGRNVAQVHRRRIWPRVLLFVGAPLGFLLFGALFIVPVVLAPYSMPSGSMIPTLRVGDHFHVLKTANPHEVPQRGDVVVFNIPSKGTDYVKRVIGLPGDTVQMQGGLLFINGSAVTREPAGDYDDGRGRVLTLYREILPGGRSHDIVERGDDDFLDNTPVFTVPPGHLFMLGDNRDNSQDSRLADFGFIPVGNLIGRATFIYWSSDLGRIGTRVE
jgi:signal peptidase I